MLYVVSRGHTDYGGGQENIVHLVSSVSLAVVLGRPWAFTDRHAELAHALHFDDLAQLAEVPWRVMGMRYWTDVKEERQAEFLVREFFPWTAVTEIGTMTLSAAKQVLRAIKSADHKPEVRARPEWYY